MRILITNDDGINAPGLKILTKIALQLTDENKVFTVVILNTFFPLISEICIIGKRKEKLQFKRLTRTRWNTCMLLCKG